MKPWASADEDVTGKPFWTIIARGRTAIGSDVIVPIWTIRRYPDFDAHLGLCFGSVSGEANSGTSS